MTFVVACCAADLAVLAGSAGVVAPDLAVSLVLGHLTATRSEMEESSTYMAVQADSHQQ